MKYIDMPNEELVTRLRQRVAFDRAPWRRREWKLMHAAVERIERLSLAVREVQQSVAGL